MTIVMTIVMPLFHRDNMKI